MGRYEGRWVSCGRGHLGNGLMRLAWQRGAEAWGKRSGGLHVGYVLQTRHLNGYNTTNTILNEHYSTATTLLALSSALFAVTRSTPS